MSFSRGQVGEFQCYDRRALASLAAAAQEAGHPEWGNMGPHDSGTYNSTPEVRAHACQQALRRVDKRVCSSPSGCSAGEATACSAAVRSAGGALALDVGLIDHVSMCWRGRLQHAEGHSE